MKAIKQLHSASTGWFRLAGFTSHCSVFDRQPVPFHALVKSVVSPDETEISIRVNSVKLLFTTFSQKTSTDQMTCGARNTESSEALRSFVHHRFMRSVTCALAYAMRQSHTASLHGCWASPQSKATRPPAGHSVCSFVVVCTGPIYRDTAVFTLHHTSSFETSACVRCPSSSSSHLVHPSETPLHDAGSSPSRLRQSR